MQFTNAISTIRKYRILPLVATSLYKSLVAMIIFSASNENSNFFVTFLAVFFVLFSTSITVWSSTKEPFKKQKQERLQYRII